MISLDCESHDDKVQGRLIESACKFGRLFTLKTCSFTGDSFNLLGSHDGSPVNANVDVKVRGNESLSLTISQRERITVIKNDPNRITL
jgi:hypothetical protein